MVPIEMLALEHDVGQDGEHDDADAFLQHFELHQIEWASVAVEPQAVGGNLAAIFKEGDAPGEADDSNQGPVFAGS